jgi:hypothetical protein
MMAAGAVLADEPPLPQGLGAPSPAVTEPVLPAGLAPADEPSLPAGLGAPAQPPSEPALPSGLDAPVTDTPALAAPAKRRLPEELSGFWEARGGVRTQNDPHEKSASLGETRLQLQYDKAGERAAIKVVSDFLYDPVLNEHDVDLEEGDGWLDLRQANLLLRPASFMDVKLGRQINTWGTGDLLFINDLFPKDWNAFFIGRDDEYLKAPSDAVKTALFGEWANLDIVYTPRFDSDRSIDGRRLSFWDSVRGRRVGRDDEVDFDKPDDAFRDDEWAARLYRNVGAYEAAAYAYDGFWKSPGGMDPQTGEATYPRLQVFGASVRGPLGKGILSLEGGWYRSADDLDGDDPFVRNSEARYLVGYEQELLQNLTGGVQYYVENMLDYGAYRSTLPDGVAAADEYRQVVTVRLTRLLLSQNLRVGVFVYYSPTDRDAYVRPNANYKLDDHWIVEVGGNVFVGEDDHTFFGQFERNNNVYASVRYGF